MYNNHMEKYTINDTFVYRYLQNKMDTLLRNYTMSLKSNHSPNENKLQYCVPEHPSDSISISVCESKIDILLPLLRSPFAYTTQFYVNNNEPTNIYKVLQFLDTHLKYYQECY